MKEIINLKDFGIAGRIKIIKNDNGFEIYKVRKSRIIMKDGAQIVDIAQLLLEHNPKAKIDLIIQGPICSKTKNLLAENQISILQM